MAVVFFDQKRSNSTKTSAPTSVGVKPKRKLPKIWYAALALIITWLIFFLVPPLNKWASQFLSSETIASITKSGPQVKNERGRTNILLLGTGGGNHEGPDLSDTIIMASVDLKTKDTQLISIPRDLWVPSLSSKINAAYAFGREKRANEGLKQAKEAVSGELGIPIHYALRLDFDGFIKAVDLIGGLDVDIENTFDDYVYPILGKENDLCGKHYEKIELLSDASPEAKDYVIKDDAGVEYPDEPATFACRFEHIHFNKGMTTMDGVTSLKYVRSRKGTNGEGSDFARSRRQERVITAFKAKVFSTDTLLNPKKIIDLTGTFKDSIDTDIGASEVTQFARLANDAKEGQIKTLSLDADKADSLLVVGDPANFGGAYVVVPKDKNKLKETIENLLYPPQPKNN